MSRLLFLISGCLLVGTGLTSSAQVGRTIDTASQKEQIRKMPMDTARQQHGKFKSPDQGGENSGKNIDNLKKPAKMDPPKKQTPSEPQSRKQKRITPTDSAAAVAYQSKREIKARGVPQRSTGLIGEGTYLPLL